MVIKLAAIQKEINILLAVWNGCNNHLKSIRCQQRIKKQLTFKK